MHITFGHKINLDSFDPNQDFYTQLQNQIDHQIQTNYKLHPNNYIAYDKLYNTTKFEKFYSHEQSALFTQHIYTQLSALPIQRELSRQIALEIYANPLKNHLIHTNS